MQTMTNMLQISLHLFIFPFLSGVLSYSHNPVQYHIQTDTGPDRYFRFQTYDGQYRKEKRYDDGTVVGTYGWVDPNGLLRLYDYIADSGGYRIARTRIMKVEPIQSNVNELQKTSEKIPYKRQRPLPASSSVRKVLPINILKTNADTSTTTSSPTTTSTDETTPDYSADTTAMDETTPSPKPKLRPLFVSKSKRKQQSKYSEISKQPQNKFNNRRRENYSSVRQQQRVQLQQQTKDNEVQSQNELPATVTVAPFNPLRRQTSRGQLFVPPVKLASENNPTFLPSETNDIPDLGYDNPGGRVAIDYDLGNQYRKEKNFADGTVVGEHGYVDPMGILRITYYKSGGSEGQQEFKRNYWVGTRLPGS